MNEIVGDDRVFGRVAHGLVDVPGGARVHRAVCEDLAGLLVDAREAGFDLRVVSGFRSFDRQLAIWNAKARGERPVLDDAGQPVDIMALKAEDRLWPILRYTALPGTSRHHWGTDVDVIDAAAVPEDYAPALTLTEARERFAGLHAWLDERMADSDCYGFVRPYATDSGGVAPEPWHLSHLPTAWPFAEAFYPPALRALLSQTELALRDEVLANLDAILERYVMPALALQPEAVV